MKRKRYSVKQIVAAVRQHDLGVSAADIARKLGIAEQIFSRWKKQYGGLEPSEVRELKQLREDNAKLKRLVADLSLDKVMLQDIASRMYGPLPVCNSLGKSSARGAAIMYPACWRIIPDPGPDGTPYRLRPRKWFDFWNRFFGSGCAPGDCPFAIHS